MSPLLTAPAAEIEEEEFEELAEVQVILIPAEVEDGKAEGEEEEAAGAGTGTDHRREGVTGETKVTRKGDLLNLLPLELGKARERPCRRALRRTRTQQEQQGEGEAQAEKAGGTWAWRSHYGWSHADPLMR